MRRVPELDALRGVAALVIVLFHLRFMNTFPLWGSAVDLFFILSGYLITTILLETRGRPGTLRTFYVRRAFRIWPIYYLTFPAFFALTSLLPRDRSRDGLPYLLTYTQFIQGYWSGAMPNFSGLYLHTWTLAIEEQFYLFWPLVVQLSGRKYLPAAILPLLIAPTVLRSCGLFGHLLLTRCDGLALGAGLALLFLDRGPPARHRHLYRVAFAAVALASLSYPAWRTPVWSMIRSAWPGPAWERILPSINILRVCLFHFGLVGLVLCDAGHPALWLLRTRWLAKLGTMSYGLYLYHPFVFKAVPLAYARLGIVGRPLIDPVRFAACLGVAALSWRYIERPILALRDRMTLGRACDPGRGPRLRPPSAAGRTGTSSDPGPRGRVVGRGWSQPPATRQDGGEPA